MGCLEDETLSRIFLTGFVGDSGPLSRETSSCIRKVFGVIDPRRVMTAGLEGNPQAAMAGSMAAFTSTLACLNESEWEDAAPRMGMNLGDRERTLCLREELGGAEELATAMAAAGKGDTSGLSGIAMRCGLDMGLGPAPTPIPAAATPTAATVVATSVPVPTATATPMATATSTPTRSPALPASTWRGITVAPENRCADYDSDDYPYSPSVEPRIVEAQGGIYGPYTGTWFDSIRETDIEHILARSEAHDSGLCAASRQTRSEFASGLLNLTLASPSVNRHQKVDKDAAEWLPELNQCWYVDRIVQVRREYGLTIDRGEADAIDTVLASCESTDMVVLPAGASTTGTATATPPPAEASTPSGDSDVDALALYDDNGNGRITCAEARAHGIAPVHRGHPAYEFMRDADGDGVVCE